MGRHQDDIEKSLSRTVEAATPDILDSLITELNLNVDQEPSLRDRIAADSLDRYDAKSYGLKQKNRIKTMRIIMSAAAVFVLVIGMAVFMRMNNGKAFAVVGLDVNPGIEININDKEKVIEVHPINRDGEIILGEMDLVGSDVLVACNALIGSMLTNGYLSDRSNSILVSVSSGNTARGQQIEKQLADSIDKYLVNTSIEASIVGQYVEADNGLIKFAEKNGISVGKALLIRKLMSSGALKMTEESLLALSTQELIFLGQERNVESDTNIGNADNSSYIGKEKALEIAVDNAGVDIALIKEVETETDCEDGIIVYEVEFEANDCEYEFDIDAITGNIISSEAENDD